MACSKVNFNFLYCFKAISYSADQEGELPFCYKTLHYGRKFSSLDTILYRINLQRDVNTESSVLTKII